LSDPGEQFFRGDDGSSVSDVPVKAVFLGRFDQVVPARLAKRYAPLSASA